MNTKRLDVYLKIIPLVLLLAACNQDKSDEQKEAAGASIPGVTNIDGVTNIEGATFIEEVKSQSGKILIPYKKYVLDNGLTVILHEDNSDPLVNVDVTYHVGSAREEAGKSGFAHFFEHMMFQGSENVADEQHFKIVTEAGGNANGTTNKDRTNYFETLPANQLEKTLWLEADRMGFLVDAVTQEKFEVQRETVKNERGQNYDNRPYGLLSERVSQALYPEGHPYSWPVIGYIEDLNRANVNDLKNFFLRWYGPNNATLTIGGDIVVKSTLELVVKYFGSIPKGPAVDIPVKPKITLDSDRYISMQDNVRQPLIHISYPTVNDGHPDEAALDILASILGRGKTSLLYKNLIKNQIATQAVTRQPCTELSCTFVFYALANTKSNKSLKDIEKIIRDTLVEFETRGVDDDDLIEEKARMEASFVFGLQSVKNKVSKLAFNQTFYNNPNYIENDIQTYNNVTKEDVVRVYNQYIKGKHAVIMSIVPKGKPEMIAAEDNFKPKERKFSAESKASADELALRKAKDNFDRSKVPVAGPSKPVDVPKMWKDELGNGIRILGSRSLETPTTSLLLRIPAGHYFESKELAGTSSILARMFSESTRLRSAEDMTRELQKLGSKVAIISSNDYLTVQVDALTKNLDKTMVLVKEKLLQPAFDEKEFERVRNTAIQSIKSGKKFAGYLVTLAFNRLLHADDIAATPSGGTETSLTLLTLKDVKDFYSQHFHPSDGQLIVVSDLEQKAIRKSMNLFSDWKGEGVELDLDLAMPNTKTGVIYLVHKDNSAQSAIRIGKRSMKRDITGEFFRSNLMNFPLGGAFNSRINLNLREDKGYTYGARTFFSGSKLVGSYVAFASVKADVTDKSIVEIVKEIKQYAGKGITADELVFLKSAINQRDALKYESPGAKLGFLAQILEYDLTPDFVRQQAEIVEKITAEEINGLAKKHLKLDEMVIVVVGNSEVLRPELKALGYEVVDYEI